MRHSQRDALPVPHSALDILRVNKQVHGEANKIFYQNDFVFSEPMEVQGFLSSLDDERLDCLRSLTLFYDKSLVKVGMDGELTGPGLGVTLILLCRLKCLRKLHLLLRFRYINASSSYHGLGKMFVDPVDITRMKDVRALMMLQGVTDFMIHDLGLVKAEKHALETTAKPHHPQFKIDHIRECIARQVAALRHFNHGLQLAQTGLVVHELYTEKNWREKDSWPTLQGSDCGLHKGCSCGVEHVEAETDENETSH
jgi:hypothetical protein